MYLRRIELTYESLEMFIQYFAKLLKPNTTILLNGEIGTGKTTWTKHLFKALGYQGVVSSPTFNLIKQYEGTSYHLVHVDAYRNTQGSYIALDEYLEAPYVLCVEWSKYIAKELPEAYIEISIEYVNPDIRLYQITLYDERYDEGDLIW